jgi:hypothetical protein
MRDISHFLNNAISVGKDSNKQNYLFYLLQLNVRLGRYFNVERLTHWGIKLLNSEEETLIQLRPDIEPSLIYPKIIEKLAWLADYEMGQMLLTICLSTMNLTTAVVKKALEAISFADVEQWFAEVFGQSMLSQRKTLFSAKIDDTETA